MHVVVSRGDGPFPDDGATWIDLRPPFGARRLRWALASRVRALAERIRPDVVIERYFNFGGEGVRAAQAVGALTLLEVNAPVIDHPGSAKRRIDRALLVEPMRRWRDWQCRHADLFVTPQADILPAVGARGSHCAAGVGRRHGAVHAGRVGRRAVRASSGSHAGGFRRRVSARGMARNCWSTRCGGCASMAATTSMRC